MNKSSISSYIYSVLAMLIVVLGLSLKVVYYQNSTLITDKAKLEVLVKDQSDALNVCTSNTKALKDREDEITNNAKEAVKKAQQKAEASQKAFNDLLNSKPESPVITPDNVQNYGGKDDNARLRDYLNAQYLINQYIDLRNPK